MSAESHSLAESNVLIIWPKASASIGITLASFVAQHRHTKSASFTLITHPVPGSVLRETEFTFHRGQDTTVRSVVHRGRHIPVLSAIVDGLLTLMFLARPHRRHDICITAGLNLGLLGIFLRTTGMVEKTAFVIMDYWPQKYGASAFSRLYRQAYGWCCTHVDFVVDVAPTINKARLADGIRVKSERQICVPHPIDMSEVGCLPQSQLEPDSLVWTGALTPECGFELVIEAVALVAPKRPGIIVNVTTYGPHRDDLWRTIRDKGLEQNFRLIGYFKKEAAFNSFVRKNRIGLAPYCLSDTSVKNFAGVARPWTYMANGVPPIITRVPPDAEEIEEAKAGMVIDYDKEQLASAIMELLTDDHLHHTCRQNGLVLVKTRAAGPVFTGLLSRLGLPPDTHPAPAGADRV